MTDPVAHPDAMGQGRGAGRREGTTRAMEVLREALHDEGFDQAPVAIEAMHDLGRAVVAAGDQDVLGAEFQ